MPDDPAQTLRSSQDPAELLVAAVTLARSGNPADHQPLGSALQSPAFLERLDSDEEYQGARQFLRISSVTKALGENLAPSARELLVQLTQSAVFLEAPARVELLIEATTGIRPPPPELVAFWDKYLDPESATVEMVIRALLQNGAPPAIELFEQKLTSDAYETEDRIWWIRVCVPPARVNLDLLKASERLIAGPLAEELRPYLVEVLFDYQPGWYRPSTQVTPADHSRLNAAGREQLRKIGAYALENVELTDDQKKVIESVMEELSSRKP